MYCSHVGRSLSQDPGRSCRSRSGQGRGCLFHSCLKKMSRGKQTQAKRKAWIPPGSEVFLLTTNSRKPAKARIWAQPSLGTTESALIEGGTIEHQDQLGSNLSNEFKWSMNCETSETDIDRKCMNMYKWNILLKPNENRWKSMKITRHHLRSCTFRPFGTSLNFRFMDGDK